MANAPFLPGASFGADAALRQPANTGLKKLVHLDAEEVRNLIQVAQLNLDGVAVVFQEFVDPRFLVAARAGELHLIFVARGEQGFDVALENDQAPNGGQGGG